MREGVAALRTSPPRGPAPVKAARARPVTQEEAPKLYAIVESPRFLDFSDSEEYQNAEYDLAVALARAGSYGAALDTIETTLDPFQASLDALKTGFNSFQAGFDPSYYDPRARVVYVSATYSFR